MPGRARGGNLGEPWWARAEHEAPSVRAPPSGARDPPPHVWCACSAACELPVPSSQREHAHTDTTQDRFEKFHTSLQSPFHHVALHHLYQQRARQANCRAGGVLAGVWEAAHEKNKKIGVASAICVGRPFFAPAGGAARLHRPSARRPHTPLHHRAAARRCAARRVARSARTPPPHSRATRLPRGAPCLTPWPPTPSPRRSSSCRRTKSGSGACPGRVVPPRILTRTPAIPHPIPTHTPQRRAL